MKLIQPDANSLSTFSAMGSGTNYTLTNSPAAVAFGTTSPTITLTAPGTYLILGYLTFLLNGATFLTSRTITCKFRRTNNTAADLVNGAVTLSSSVTSALTQTLSPCILPNTIYSTVNNNDAVTIFADVGTLPSVGTLECSAAQIVAIKIG